MKVKVSISMEEKLDKRLEEKVQASSSIFRSKSHLIEYAVKSFLKKEKMEAREK